MLKAIVESAIESVASAEPTLKWIAPPAPSAELPENVTRSSASSAFWTATAPPLKLSAVLAATTERRIETAAPGPRIRRAPPPAAPELVLPQISQSTIRAEAGCASVPATQIAPPPTVAVFPIMRTRRSSAWVPVPTTSAPPPAPAPLTSIRSSAPNQTPGVFVLTSRIGQSPCPLSSTSPEAGPRSSTEDSIGGSAACSAIVAGSGAKSKTIRSGPEPAGQP